MKECIEDFNIDVVINCAAYTNVNDAEINRKQAILINAESVNNISSICEKKNIQLIHISSDYVFDGKKMVYILSIICQTQLITMDFQNLAEKIQ